jgi:hypothetical protein
MADTASRLGISIQIVPFEAGANPGQDYLFTILSYTEAVRDVVCLDLLHGDLYLEVPKELEFYRSIFSRMASIALDVDASISFIRKMAAHT